MPQSKWISLILIYCGEQLFKLNSIFWSLDTSKSQKQFLQACVDKTSHFWQNLVDVLPLYYNLHAPQSKLQRKAASHYIFHLNIVWQTCLSWLLNNNAYSKFKKKKKNCHYNLHLTVSFLASTGKILPGEFTNINLTKSIHLLWQHSPGSLLAWHEYSFHFFPLWSCL